MNEQQMEMYQHQGAVAFADSLIGAIEANIPDGFSFTKDDLIAIIRNTKAIVENMGARCGG